MHAPQAPPEGDLLPTVVLHRSGTDRTRLLPLPEADQTMLLEGEDDEAEDDEAEDDEAEGEEAHCEQEVAHEVCAAPPHPSLRRGHERTEGDRTRGHEDPSVFEGGIAYEVFMLPFYVVLVAGVSFGRNVTRRGRRPVGDPSNCHKTEQLAGRDGGELLATRGCGAAITTAREQLPKRENVQPTNLARGQLAASEAPVSRAAAVRRNVRASGYDDVCKLAPRLVLIDRFYQAGHTSLMCEAHAMRHLPELRWVVSQNVEHRWRQKSHSLSHGEKLLEAGNRSQCHLFFSDPALAQPALDVAYSADDSERRIDGAAARARGRHAPPPSPSPLEPLVSGGARRRRARRRAPGAAAALVPSARTGQQQFKALAHYGQSLRFRLTF